MRRLAAIALVLGALGVTSASRATVEGRLQALPRSGVIILYGDGPVERVLGAYHLIRPGRAGNVYVLEGGLEGWRRAGYTLER